MTATLKRADRRPVVWRVLPGLTPYAEAIAAMHRAHAEIVAGAGREAVWLLELPAGFNPGSRSRPDDVRRVAGLAIEAVTGRPRAGDWSYHGPGVRALLLLIDLRARRRDTGGFVSGVHRWLIAALASLGFAGRRESGDVDPAGVYVGTDKVASIGFRASAWVTSYGVGLHVAPELANFAGIAQCGIKDRGVTSLAALALAAGRRAPTMIEVDLALRAAFAETFGPTSLAD